MKLVDLMNLCERHGFDAHVSKVAESELTPRKFVELMNRVPQSHYHVGHTCNNFEYERIILVLENKDCFEAIPQEYNTSPAGGDPEETQGFVLRDCITPEVYFNDVNRIILYDVEHLDDNAHPNGYDRREIIIWERQQLLSHWLPDCEGDCSSIASRLEAMKSEMARIMARPIGDCDVPPALGPVDCDNEPEPVRRR